MDFFVVQAMYYRFAMAVGAGLGAWESLTHGGIWK